MESLGARSEIGTCRNGWETETGGGGGDSTLAIGERENKFAKIESDMVEKEVREVQQVYRTVQYINATV